MASIGRKIKAVRIMRDWSAAYFCKRADDIHPSTLSNIELDKQIPQIATRQKIEKALGFRLNDPVIGVFFDALAADLPETGESIADFIKRNLEAIEFFKDSPND